MNWTYHFGIASDQERGSRLCSSNDNNPNLLRALLNTAKPALDEHQYNAMVAFRNVSRIGLPKEGYAAKIVCFVESNREDVLVRVTEDGVLRRFKHGEPSLFSGYSDVSVECGEEVVGLICYSIRSETLCPKLRELGFPLRQDSYEAPMEVTGVAGKLTDADLTSHGYERKMLAALTVECNDFGPLFRCKQLEGVYSNRADLRRAVMAPGWTTAQTNHAINISDR